MIHQPIRDREVIDARLDQFGAPCEACGHRMVRFRGQCWSDCGCTRGKHAAAAVPGTTGGDHA